MGEEEILSTEDRRNLSQGTDGFVKGANSSEAGMMTL